MDDSLCNGDSVGCQCFFSYFCSAAPTCNAALENAICSVRDKYDSKINENIPSRNRKRNIIWCSPPYIKGVSTNIGRVFLNSLDKHFLNEHKLNKIFSRSNVEVSNSCTRIIEHVDKDHNRKITESNIEKGAEASCNCKEKNIFLLDENYLTKHIVYMATAKTKTNTSSYVGITGNSFKTRYYNHIKSFKTKRNKNETDLAKYIWKHRDKEVEHSITWKELLQSANDLPTTVRVI